ncbi:hypothetical protein H7Y21_00910 [Arenimonas sp.]|nr:hypothetical protein [Candidatus Parcubacteria bacterium]
MNNTYYEEKLETLSENLQHAVLMSNWKESLVAIQNQFKLHIDQTQILEESTIKLMFGDIDAPDFINHMFTEAHINSEMAADILLEVDLKILKKIRETLESIEAADEAEEKMEDMLLNDDDREARETSDNFAKYYTEIDKINKQTEEELLAEGILPDGSNITDEMLGITQEIPENISQEKDDLLNEINTPSKSFTNINLFSTPKPIIEPEPEPIPVDHQIENVSLEKPFHEENIIPEIPQPIAQPEIKPAPISTTLKPTDEIRKPITINLDDIYREPLE